MIYLHIASYVAVLVVGGYLGYRYGRYVESAAQSALKKL
jgi:hypothetical protein